jgi:hypothetical protein
MKRNRSIVFLLLAIFLFQCTPDFERENNPKLLRTIDSLSIVRYSQAQDSLREICNQNKEEEVKRMVDSLVLRGLRDYERLKKQDKSRQPKNENNGEGK